RCRRSIILGSCSSTRREGKRSDDCHGEATQYSAVGITLGSSILARHHAPEFCRYALWSCGTTLSQHSVAVTWFTLSSGSVSGQLFAVSLTRMSESDVKDALMFRFGRPLTPKSDQCLRGEEFFGGVDDSLEYRVQCVAPPHQPQRDRGIAGIINFSDLHIVRGN